MDQPIVDRLRQDGHNVLAVAELEPSIPDETVLVRANQGGALLLTADKDFGESVFRQRQVTAGVVLIRYELHDAATTHPGGGGTFPREVRV